MMDETEIKCEFPQYEDQCSVCFSVGRKLCPLGEYTDVFMRITSDIRNRIYLPLEQIKLCWECYAFLRRARIFKQQADKANEMLQLGQNYLYGTQSSLTSIILNESHPHTIYVTDLTISVPEVKICDKTDDDEIDDTGGFDDNDDCLKSEEGAKNTGTFSDTKPDTDQTWNNHIPPKNISPLKESKPEKKPKNNRWAKKKALLNKRPKFKIITEFANQCFRRVQIYDEEIRSLLKSERDDVYFKSKRFRCEECVLTFSSQDVLVRHRKRFHCELLKYACDICTSTFSSKRQMSRHVREHYYKYQCTLCDFTCCDKSQTKWHYERRHRKVFQCLKCELKFGSRWEFFKHYKEWHEKFVCDHCGISFKMRYCIKDHIRKQHSPFECKPCNKRWARYNGLWLHNKTTHSLSDSTAQSDAPAYCVECDTMYRDVYRYRWHLASSARHRQHKKHSTAQSDAPAYCVECDTMYRDVYRYRWHLASSARHRQHKKHSTAQSDAPAYCVECDTMYRDVYRYRWHLASSARHRQHKKHRIPCPGCDKIFSKNIYMKDHYNLVHLKFYKYRCEECDKNFIRNADLVKHTRRVHEGILPPKNKICYMCGRGFSTNKILTNHLRTHTGEKPFACSICSARFAQSTALSAHARAIHHTVQKQ